MFDSTNRGPGGRRAVLRAALAAGAANLAPPFMKTARGEQPILIGIGTALTGTYAALGKNSLVGCELAVSQMNAKGGILGRPVELRVEDISSSDAGTAVQKARKLIERDKVNFLLSDGNAAMALAVAQVSAEKGILHIVPGAHSDAITGANCHWNVFRVANATRTEANAAAQQLIEKAGRNWYYITPDYAFGHGLQAGLERAAERLGATKVGADLVPLGTTDFSSYLIKAQAANPDAIVLLVVGDDMVNALKQAVQFGLDKRIHLAGAQQDLESLGGLPPEARIGYWVFEWYWKQPGVRYVADFVEVVRKKTRKVPTAFTRFGFIAAWSCALAAESAKGLDATKMAKALGGMKLPPEIGLTPDTAFYRAEDHQLIASLYVGNAQSGGTDPEDLFNVTQVIRGIDVAGRVEDSPCKLVWPS